MKKYPTSVYRLQLTEQFSIAKATALLPLLAELGVDGVYCSPYFAAHSAHGYDVLNPNAINPKLASKKEYDAFCKEMQRLNLFHIADVVPNHMGVIGENPWLWDVLLHGQKSEYARFFAIDWEIEKIEIAILGTSYEEALKARAFKIGKKEEGLFVTYGGATFPLNPSTYSDGETFKTADEIHELLEKQVFRLVHWRSSAKRISYRRFFNINELIGLRIEDKQVYDAYHKLLFQLLDEGKINGLRIDHPDGLYDPTEYLLRLRKKHKGFIALEKILGWGEELPSEWPAEGSVGYEYLNMLSGLFAKKGVALTEIYRNFSGETQSFSEILYEKKKFFMATEMAGDVDRLTRHLYAFISQMTTYIDLPIGHIRDALVEFLAAFPIYRTYIRPTGPVPKRDIPYIKEALAKARKKGRELEERAFALLEEVFLLKMDTPYLRDWICQFQQISAPIMAKGFEDITLYNDNRLLSLNEVGSDPDRGGVDIAEFHAFCKRKAAKWPMGVLSTSTHDTKRSLDARMQIAPISELPDAWKKTLSTASKSLEKHKTRVGDELFPDRNAEYVIYQLILAIWPSNPSFSRLWTPVLKSLKEARAYTSWRHPNELYEKAAAKFLKAAMKCSILLKFQKRIEKCGYLNTLSATTLLLGSPGIVDIYEGCERLRFSLVDPDNRREVEFRSLRRMLPEMERPKKSWFTSLETGEAKLYLHKVGLTFRNQHPDLFLKGKYIPLIVTGPEKDHIIAFLRTYRRETLVVAATRHQMHRNPWGTTTIHFPKILGEGRDLFFHQNKKLGKTVKAKDLFAKAPFTWLYFSS